MRHGSTWTSSVALACLLGCGSEEQAPGFSASLQERMPALLSTHGVPGAAVALVEGGALTWTHGFGLAATETQTPVSPSTVFQVASLSKSVTAWGVARLVESGRMDLDAPIDDYLRRWQLPASSFDRRGVTPRRLLSHTAGLSVHGYGGYPPDAPLPSLVESLSGAADPDYAVALVQSPGAGFVYSGGGFTVLQLAIEDATGASFAGLMQREVLAPLGMTRSSFKWDDGLRASTAGAYDERGRRLPNYLFAEQAAAGFYTTAEDLGRWVAAGLSAGASGAPGRSVLSPPSVALLHAPAAATGGQYGLGHEVYSLPGAPSAVGHGGVNIGWRAQWAAVPERGLGIAVLTNSENGGALVTEVVCSWYEGVVRASPSYCR